MGDLLGQRPPSLADRPALIRLEAAIAEVQRLRSAVSVGIPHGTMQVSVEAVYLFTAYNKPNEKIHLYRRRYTVSPNLLPREKTFLAAPINLFASLLTILYAKARIEIKFKTTRCVFAHIQLLQFRTQK